MVLFMSCVSVFLSLSLRVFFCLFMDLVVWYKWMNEWMWARKFVETCFAEPTERSDIRLRGAHAAASGRTIRWNQWQVQSRSLSTTQSVTHRDPPAGCTHDETPHRVELRTVHFAVFAVSPSSVGRKTQKVNEFWWNFLRGDICLTSNGR